MAKIDIRHQHKLPLDQAREKLRALAREFESRFKLTVNIKGDSVDIKGTGVKGELSLQDGKIGGFLDVPFFIKGKVERALQERMQKEFPA